MVRRAAIFVVALAAACGGGVAVADTSQASQASLGSFVCQQSSYSLNRMIEVTATMRAVPGTQRMAMRFQLLEQLPDGRTGQVYGGDLNRWRHPNPPTFGSQPGDTWVVNKPVVNLGAPAVYRFRVTFRWIGSAGVIDAAVRLSRLCTEPLSPATAGPLNPATAG